MIKYIIVDDENAAHDIIEDYGKNLPNLVLKKHCYTAFEAIEYLNNHTVDLIFLDINMPTMNGLEFLKTLTYRPFVIITTAYREYAVESFDLNVLDYLVKPIPFSRFLKSVNKLNQRLGLERVGSKDISLKEEPFIFLKVDKKLMKVKLNDILYIESLKDYIKVITISEEFLVHKSMTSISEELPSDRFIRIHRSFTISLNKITFVEGNSIKIANRRIPIGRNYLQAAKQKILNLKGGENS
jgi:DNA-binding LytR/AlgR family response regulator